MSDLDGPLPAEQGMYVLDAEGKPVPAKTLREWGAFVENQKARTVAKTELPGGVLVSTVFLAMDHGFGNKPPVLWETMVFGGPFDQEEARYSSLEQAKEGHEKMVAHCLLDDHRTKW